MSLELLNHNMKSGVVKHKWSVNKLLFSLDIFEGFNKPSCITHVPCLMLYFVKLKRNILAQDVE